MRGKLVLSGERMVGVSEDPTISLPRHRSGSRGDRMGSFQASGLLQDFTVQGEGEAEPSRLAHGSGLIGTAFGLLCLYPTGTIWSTTCA
jgi:hypothetical protein